MDCWSPIMVALDAHLHMVHEIIDHLKGLGKKEWWATKEVQGEQIRSRADKWEATVRDLKWRGVIPDREELLGGRAGEASSIRSR